MIQRYLIDLLKSGFDAMVADPLILDELFSQNYGLEDDEVEVIKDYFAAHYPTLVSGYSRQDQTYPLIAVTLGNEGESETVLGDDGGMVLDEDHPFHQCDINVAIWEHTYYLTVLTEHPDITAYYYEMTKSIVLAGLDQLIDRGLASIRVSGQELILDPAYTPEHLFVRRLLFTCERELQQIVHTSRLGKAFRIEGISIDNSGSPSDVEEVKANVTTYIDGETDAGEI